jgi:hypothetical protein
MAYIVFRSAKVQHFLVQKTISWVSNHYKFDIQLKGIDFELFHTFVFDGIYVEDLNKDTLIYVDKLTISIDELNLKQQSLKIDEIGLYNGVISLNIAQNDSVLNLTKIIQLFLDDSEDSKTASTTHFTCGHIELQNIRFIYDDENSEKIDYGIDFNHLYVSKLFGKIDDLTIEGDTIQALVNHISFQEQSGFVLNKLIGQVKVSPLEIAVKAAQQITPHSNLLGDFKLSYKSYDDFSDFINKVKLDNQFLESTLSMKDLSYFVPDFQHINNTFVISGKTTGKISNIKGKDLSVSFGKLSVLKGDILLVGLPEIESTFIMVDHANLVTNKYDLEQIPIPPFDGKSYVQLPPNIATLGVMNFDGKFTGFLNDFVVYGKLNTINGDIQADLKFLMDTIAKKPFYAGDLVVNKFNLGVFYGEESLGKLSLNTNIRGEGLTIENMKFNLDGTIRSVELLGYNYEFIKINAEILKNAFNGQFNIKDEHIDLQYSGTIDFNGKLPKFDFLAQLNHIDLKALQLSNRESETTISGEISANITGNAIDNIDGNIALTNFKIKEENDSISFDKLMVDAQNIDKNKKITLDSDFLRGEIYGKFKKEELYRSFGEVLNQSLPVYFSNVEKYDEQNFQFHFQLLDVNPILKVFYPDLNIQKEVNVKGSYASNDKKLLLNIDAPHLKLLNTNYDNLIVDFQAIDGILGAKIDVQKLWISDSLYLDNVMLLSKIYNNIVQYDLSWKNMDSLPFYGDFSGLFHFLDKNYFRLNVLSGTFAAGGSEWKVDPKNVLEIDSNSLWFQDFYFYNQDQKIGLEGRSSDKSYHTLKAIFENVDLTIFNPVLKPYQTELSGTLNGETAIVGTLSDFIFSSDLNIQQLFLNKDSLGDGIIKANWLNQEKKVQFESKLGKLLDVEGNYFLSDENIEATIKFNDIELAMIEPFTKDVVSQMKGQVSGKLKLSGKIQEPQLKGKLSLSKGSVKVDYLNAVYSFNNQSIIVDKDWFGFDLIKLKDQFGNTAVATGTITHNNYSDFNFDIVVDAKNFLALNTQAIHNSDYYGKAFVTGNINLSGTPENLLMNIKIKTEKDTKFFIPLSNSSDVADIPYIKFVNKNELNVEEEYKVDLSGIQLNFDLEATPDAEIQIIFDEKTGDVIRARGSGNIKMEINTNGKFNIYGNYEITEGDYLFTLENIINKKFEVMPGGNINWSGDPYTALMDVNAVYKLRAPLKDLNIPEVDTSGKRVPVDCILNLSGGVASPDILFDINLPTMRENDNMIVKNAINGTGDMNKQVFSLLLLNRFIPVNQSLGFNASGVGGATSSEVLSNQLSNWLSKISDEFDVGLNYRPGDEISSTEVEVALSTQLFNDRVSVETNIGLATDNSTTDNRNNQLAGDFIVEYKMTKDGKIRAKMYNQSNDYNDITDASVRYTQGAAVFYREEFDTWSELWRKVFRKKKATNEENID